MRLEAHAFTKSKKLQNVNQVDFFETAALNIWPPKESKHS